MLNVCEKYMTLIKGEIPNTLHSYIQGLPHKTMIGCVIFFTNWSGQRPMEKLRQHNGLIAHSLACGGTGPLNLWLEPGHRKGAEAQGEVGSEGSALSCPEERVLNQPSLLSKEGLQQLLPGPDFRQFAFTRRARGDANTHTTKLLQNYDWSLNC